MKTFALRHNGASPSWLRAEVGCRGARVGLKPVTARCGGFLKAAQDAVHVADVRSEAWLAWDALRLLGGKAYAQPFLCGQIGTETLTAGFDPDCSRCVESAKERMR